MMRCLANAVHPAVIHLGISLSCILSMVLYLFLGDVAFNFLCLSSVDRLVCRLPSSSLSSTCSSSDPDFYLDQLVPAAFVEVPAVY